MTRRWKSGRSLTAITMWLWERINRMCREIFAVDLLTGYRPSPFVTGSPSYRLIADEVQELRLWLRARCPDWPDSVSTCLSRPHGRLGECDA
jgi:hypothetical protein